MRSSSAVSKCGIALKAIATSKLEWLSDAAMPGIPCWAANSAASRLWRWNVTRQLKTSTMSILPTSARLRSGPSLMCEARNGSNGCGMLTSPPCRWISSAVSLALRPRGIVLVEEEADDLAVGGATPPRRG